MLVNELVELEQEGDMVCALAATNKGWFEPETFDFIMKHVDDDTVFVDCGSYTGFYSIAVHLVTDSTTIFAFDPSDKARTRMIKNVSANVLDERPTPAIIISDLALSDGQRKQNLVSKSTTNFITSSSTVEDQEEIDHETMSISAIKTVDFDSYYLWWIDSAYLDEINDDFNYTARLYKNGVSCVKIDVEGHELSVLKGMAETLIKDRPALVVESLDEDHATKIKNYLAIFSYKYVGVADKRNLLFV